MVWKTTARQPAQGHQRKMTAWPRQARSRCEEMSVGFGGGTLQRTTRNTAERASGRFRPSAGAAERAQSRSRSRSRRSRRNTRDEPCRP